MGISCIHIFPCSLISMVSVPHPAVSPKGWHLSVLTDSRAKGKTLVPLCSAAKIPLASKKRGFHLLFFMLHFVRDPLGSFIKTTSKQAAMTQGTGMCPWESLSGTDMAPGMARRSLQWEARLSLPLSPSSDRSCRQSPKESSTPTAIMHSVLIPLFSHLLLTENVLALDVDRTYQGLDPAVLGLGRQHRFMAQTT